MFEYADLDLEVFQGINATEVSAQSISGAPISVIGTETRVESINKIWAFDP